MLRTGGAGEMLGALATRDARATLGARANDALYLQACAALGECGALRLEHGALVRRCGEGPLGRLQLMA